MNKKLIPAFIAGTLCLTQTAASAAGLVDFTGHFNNAFQDLLHVLEDTIAEEYSPQIAGLMQKAVNQAVGVFGYPAPYTVAESIEEQLGELPQPDVTQPVPMSETADMEQTFNRDLLSQQIETVLGKSGQDAAAQRTEGVESLISQTQSHADRAQAAVSTQAAIKEMVQLQADSAALLGTLHRETLQSRQDTAAQSLAVVDISESLDQQRDIHRLERRGEVLTSLEQAAAARLF
ncbi:hypothetical protein PN498_13240 [Oscillatoria sp. CS-180]|uniref:hypothetical protein n=1 Tax=Oscillatoria sp. CS-180 TaxID=3021720 RepID=UPI0023301B91|nr:hypothetical protein [Oscillatoria sp. CS-180]MDB9526958.1 hypothetical protein [Oscillatoria sp. CS-180]